MRTLFEDGMIKAMKGITTLEEVMRITQHDITSTSH
jgi:type IV pilus assembly protein PilB